VQQLIGDTAQGMWISTFHSACVRILRREADQFGFTRLHDLRLRRLARSSSDSSSDEADAFG
jgi:superfamily I DNA/RNA helicase